MIFIVSGTGENGIVTMSCATAPAALLSARRLIDEGVNGVLINAGGHEYAPSDFDRLFVVGIVEPDSDGEQRS